MALKLVISGFLTIMAALTLSAMSSMGSDILGFCAQEVGGRDLCCCVFGDGEVGSGKGSMLFWTLRLQGGILGSSLFNAICGPSHFGSVDRSRFSVLYRR